MAYGKRTYRSRKRGSKRYSRKRRRYNRGTNNSVYNKVRQVLTPTETQRVSTLAHFQLDAGLITAAQTPVANRSLIYFFNMIGGHAGGMNAAYDSYISGASGIDPTNAPDLTDEHSAIYFVKEFMTCTLRNNDKHPIVVFAYGLTLKKDINWFALSGTSFPLTPVGTGDGSATAGYTDATPTAAEEIALNNDVGVKPNYRTTEALDVCAWHITKNMHVFKKTNVSVNADVSFYYRDNGGTAASGHGMVTAAGGLDIRNIGPMCKGMYRIKCTGKYFMNPGDSIKIVGVHNKMHRLGDKGKFCTKAAMSAAEDQTDRLMVQKGYTQPFIIAHGTLAHDDNTKKCGRGFIQLDCEMKRSLHYSWRKNLDAGPKAADYVAVQNWIAADMDVPVAPSAHDMEAHTDF